MSEVTSRNPEGTDALIAQYQATRSQRAIAGLLRQYAHFLKSEASRAASSYRIDADDAYQIASLALIRAVEMYDPAFGCALMTYARPKIRSSLVRMISRRDAVETPSSWQSDYYRIRRAIRELQALGNPAPTPQDIADVLDRYSVRRIADVLAGAPGVSSLDAPLGPDSTKTIADRLPSSAPGPYDLTEAKLDGAAARAAVIEALEGLPPRQCQIASMVLLDDLSQVEVAERLGVLRQTVSLAMHKVIPRLQQALAGDVRVTNIIGAVTVTGVVPDGRAMIGA